MSVNKGIKDDDRTTRFIFNVFHSSLIGTFNGYCCERCDAKYENKARYEHCPFCKREITEYVYKEVRL